MIEAMMMLGLCLIVIGVFGVVLNVLGWLLRPIVNWLGKSEKWF